MNNIRYDVFSCFRKQLLTIQRDTAAYDQLMTLVDYTLQHLDNNPNCDEIITFSRKQLLIALHEQGKYLDKYDASTFINPKKINPLLEQAVFSNHRPVESFIDIGYIPIFKYTGTEGGRGIPAKIHLDIEKINLTDIDNSFDIEDESEISQDIFSIQYQRKISTMIKPSLFTRLFFKDGELKMYSFKGFSFLLLIIFSFLLEIISLIYSIFIFISIKESSILSLQSILLVILIAFSYINWFHFFKPLNDLITHRIIKAPMFLINIDVDNAEIEFFREKYTKKNQLYNVARLTEITATCPICTAPIILAHGKPDQKVPLVGRCTEAPHAHVYSFDRITMKGYFLGHHGYLSDPSYHQE